MEYKACSICDKELSDEYIAEWKEKYKTNDLTCKEHEKISALHIKDMAREELGYGEIKSCLKL